MAQLLLENRSETSNSWKKFTSFLVVKKAIYASVKNSVLGQSLPGDPMTIRLANKQYGTLNILCVDKDEANHISQPA